MRETTGAALISLVSSKTSSTLFFFRGAGDVDPLLGDPELGSGPYGNAASIALGQRERVPQGGAPEECSCELLDDEWARPGADEAGVVDVDLLADEARIEDRGGAAPEERSETAPRGGNGRGPEDVKT